MLAAELRELQMREQEGGDLPGAEGSNLNAQQLTEKQQIILKLRSQNETLKSELKGLSGKLEQYVSRSKAKKLQMLKEKHLQNMAGGQSQNASQGG